MERALLHEVWRLWRVSVEKQGRRMLGYAGTGVVSGGGLAGGEVHRPQIIFWLA